LLASITAAAVEAADVVIVIIQSFSMSTTSLPPDQQLSPTAFKVTVEQNAATEIKQK
jgi:hypothetical protein